MIGLVGWQKLVKFFFFFLAVRLQAGLLAALAKLVKQGDMPPEVREALSEALKHLTASSQKNRNTLVSLQVLPLLIVQLTTGKPCTGLRSTRTGQPLFCQGAMLEAG